MHSRSLLNNLKAETNMALVAVIAILVITSSSIGFILFAQGDQRVVESGDKVKVDYIGMFPAPDGRVFDTSLYSVAIDNSPYPKSLSFAMRSNASKYTPLEFTQGSGGMIKGFDQAVLGMKVGETKTVTILPNMAYGALDPKKLVNISLEDTVPVYESMTFTAFQAAYGQAPEFNLLVKSPIWGWDQRVSALYSSNGTVWLENIPTIGSNYAAYGAPSNTSAYGNVGWYVQVLSRNSSANGGWGEIGVKHLLEEEDGRYLKGVDSAKKSFILESVDWESNVAVLNYNTEVTGQTLEFTITLVAIL